MTRRGVTTADVSGGVARPATVRAADLGHAIVLLHQHTGAVITLIGPHRHAWFALAATGTADSSGAADSSDVTEGNAAALAGRLCSAGFLVATDTAHTGPWPACDVQVPPSTPSWGTQEAPGALPPPPRLRPRRVPAAAVALLVVLAVRGLGPRRSSFARLLALMRRVGRGCLRPASATQTAQVLDCVRVIGGLVPWRTACLEETVAAVLALALAGRRAGWCHGIAADPIRLHAWLTVDGHPVAEPTSTLRFTAWIHLPGGLTQPAGQSRGVPHDPVPRHPHRPHPHQEPGPQHRGARRCP